MAIFRRRQVGLIYQFYNLIPILNVEENITLPCDLDGKNVNKEQLKELLKTLGLENRVKHLPNQLSGGQQQRVTIGRAIANKPKVLIADEPTGNLDPEKSLEIISLLEKINQKLDTTIMMVTHDKVLVDHFKKRTIMLDKGYVIHDSNKGGYKSL